MCQLLEHRISIIGNFGDRVRSDQVQGGYKVTLLWRFNQNKKDAVTGYVPPVDEATVAARLGRGDEAIAYLEKAYQEHSGLLELIQEAGKVSCDGFLSHCLQFHVLRSGFFQAVTTMGILGGFAGPAWMGWMKDFTGGYQQGLMTLAFPCFIAAFTVLNLRRRALPGRKELVVKAEFHA
jgi:hypothetical protein